MGTWTDLPESGLVGALCFCRCTEESIEIEEYDEYLVCITCGTWKDRRTMKRTQPRLALNS